MVVIEIWGNTHVPGHWRLLAGGPVWVAPYERPDIKPKGRGTIGLCPESSHIIARIVEAGYRVTLQREEDTTLPTDADRERFQAVLEKVFGR